MLLPTKENLDDNPNDYAVIVKQLKLLIENCHGAINIPTIVNDYTDDIRGLIATLQNL